MKYVAVTAYVQYSNGFTDVECFVIPLEKFHSFERDVYLKSNGHISVIDMLKVEPCEC